MTGLIEVTREGAVQCIRFNRPEKKNAITVAMYNALAGALRQGDADDVVRCHVLLGSGGSFTAGNDIADFQQSGDPVARLAEIKDFLTAISTTEKPLLAAVDGLAVGVGVTLLMHCDMVFATPQSWFQTPFTALGLVPEAASSLLGPRLMGYARAFELLVAGEKFSAERALACGVINNLYPAADLEAETLKMAAKLAALPAGAVKISKRLLKGEPEDVARRIDAETALFIERLGSGEAQAAFRAFFARA